MSILTSNLQLLYKAKIPKVRVETFASKECGSVQDLIVREWLNFVQLRAPKHSTIYSGVAQKVRLRLPTRTTKCIELEDGFEGLDPDDLIRFVRKAPELPKIRLLTLASSPYLLFHLMLQVPAVTIKSWKNGISYLYGYSYNKESRSCELWLISTADTDSVDGLKFLIPTKSPGQIQYWQSAGVKQIKLWLPFGFPVVENLTHSCSLIAASTVYDSLPPEVGEIFCKDNKVFLTDQQLECRVSTGLTSYPYSYTPTADKGRYPYLWVGQHLRAVAFLPPRLFKASLEGVVENNDEISLHLNRTFSIVLEQLAVLLKEHVEQRSLAEATLECARLLKKIFYGERYVHRFFEITPIRWGKSRTLIELSYIEKLRLLLHDRECKDIEIEFYGHPSEGNYLHGVNIEYVLMDRDYHYDEATLVGLFQKPSCIVVIRYYQPPVSAKTRPISLEACSFLRHLNCRFADKVGLRAKERYSLLETRLTLRQVISGHSDCPYRHPMMKHLQEVNVNTLNRTGFIVCPQRSVAAARYHLGLQHFDPLFTIQELVLYSSAFNQDIYVANSEEMKVLKSFTSIEDFLREVLIKNIDEDEELASLYESVNLLSYLGHANVLRTADLVRIMEDEDLSNALKRFADDTEDAVLSLFLSRLVQGLEEYANYRRSPQTWRASQFRWLLIDKTLRSLPRDLTSQITERYSLLPRMLATGDSQLILYLPEYVNSLKSRYAQEAKV